MNISGIRVVLGLLTLSLASYMAVNFRLTPEIIREANLVFLVMSVLQAGLLVFVATGLTPPMQTFSVMITQACLNDLNNQAIRTATALGICLLLPVIGILLLAVSSRLLEFIYVYLGTVAVVSCSYMPKVFWDTIKDRANLLKLMQKIS